jgi:hypothetical protein
VGWWRWLGFLRSSRQRGRRGAIRTTIENIFRSGRNHMCRCERDTHYCLSVLELTVSRSGKNICT